ncbi:MAG: ATP-binding domain-containing protein, partial [Actinobacteria bacterium]|nr:ATP-binding domain-containing protein [Actinomycetota bacterium]
DALVGAVSGALGDVEHRVLGGAPDDAEEEWDTRVEVVPAGLAKGLEFDHVLLLEPAAVVAGEHDRLTGLRRLYVCLTRAVTSLQVLHVDELPAELGKP